ncbi:DnaJ family domain-containing protein [Huaxiibacter chinensis]|uniref:DnaJ family domain-containing protein n=1 Tax=Huaxiibacter chinensis TaxID=2899785 RepID=UPI003D3175FC
MWLLDQWAERHILDAQRQGEFDDLPGSGEPLILDDDLHVPTELRAGYRLLKNAGCLPPELQQRKEAVDLADLLKTVRQDEPEYEALSRRLALLELKLRQAGLSTDFLQGEYAQRLATKMKENE